MVNGAWKTFEALPAEIATPSMHDDTHFHSPTQVFWKATNMAPFSKGMNVLARFVMEESGIIFIDTQDIFYYFKEDIAAACCNDHQGKGFHFGAVAHYTNSTLRVTVSSMVTQRILEHMCKTEHNTQ